MRTRRVAPFITLVKMRDGVKAGRGESQADYDTRVEWLRAHKARNIAMRKRSVLMLMEFEYGLRHCPAGFNENTCDVLCEGGVGH